MEKETRMMIIKPVLLSGLDANASNLSAREAGKLHTYKRASLAIQEWKTASSWSELEVIIPGKRERY